MSSPKNSYKGACECGAVRFEYQSSMRLSEHTARACQCDYCKPGKSQYLSETDASLDVYLKDSRLLYAHRFGTSTADFMHCAICNSQVFVRSEIGGQLFALVHVAALEESDIVTQVEEVEFEGEGLSDRLDRRANNWIPELNIHVEREA